MQEKIRLIIPQALLAAAVAMVLFLWNSGTKDTDVDVSQESVMTETSEDTTSMVQKAAYRDMVAPEISLNGKQQQFFEAGGDYTDPGYSAADDHDGDLTSKVKVEGTVDGHKPGSYTITYSVEDAAKNVCEVKRLVIVMDTTAPSIILKGSSSIYVELGSDFTDPGFSAVDTQDGEITGRVHVSSSVDTGRRGVYSVNYSVEDAAGNKSFAERDVFVYQKQDPVDTIKPEGKVVYLTFDDGPGKYTSKLLKTLDKYNVKVTFFVTNQHPDYRELIKSEHAKGHTVALHSYTHDYSKIYSNQEAFFEDIGQMSEICKELTGVEPTIIRFPGGSSNSISKKYCRGIMTQLSESVEKMGYQYCDWNVVSGDAGETTATCQIVNNVVDGMKSHDISVVLQHDVKGYSVDAVEEIVAWGLANGYTFLPLDETSPMVHHGLTN